MRYVRGFSINATSTALTLVMGFGNQVMLAKLLGKEEYGQLTLWFTSVFIAALVLGEWLNKGSTYVVGRDGHHGIVAGNALLYAAALAAALWGLVEGLAWLDVPALPTLTTWQWRLLAGLTVLSVLQKVGEAILLGLDRIVLYSAVSVVFVCCYLGANVVVLSGFGLGLPGVLGAWLFASIAAVATAWSGLLSGGTGPGLDRALLRRTLSVGGRGAVSVVLVFLLFRSNFYLVEYFLGAALLGVYRVATNFDSMMQRLPNAAGTVLLPKVIRDQGRAEGLSLRVALGVLLFSVVAALFFFLSGKFLIRVTFGEEYIGAYEPLVWMLPGLVCSGFGSILNTRLSGLGYPPVTIWAPAIALAVGVTSNVILIPDHGLVGAAAATSVSYALWTALVSVAYLRRRGSSALS